MANLIHKFKTLFDVFSPIPEDYEGMNHSYWSRTFHKRQYLGLVTSTNKINYFYNPKTKNSKLNKASIKDTLIIKYIQFKDDKLNINDVTYVAFNIGRNYYAKDIIIVKTPEEYQKNILYNAFLSTIYSKKAFPFSEVDTNMIEQPSFMSEVINNSDNFDTIGKNAFFEMITLKYLSSIRKNDSKVLVIPLEGKPWLRKVADEDSFLESKIHDKNTISLPIDEYTIYSSNNYSPENHNKLAENVLSNPIKSMHKDSKYSAANYTANNDIGNLYGLVIIVGCCGQW
tara:strand:- start:426 stop:1280 length:855 start_codon:yes stop_codon:yes gene_type:complete